METEGSLPRSKDPPLDPALNQMNLGQTLFI
jgi:hypothetical protein